MYEHTHLQRLCACAALHDVTVTLHRTVCTQCAHVQQQHTSTLLQAPFYSVLHTAADVAQLLPSLEAACWELP
jgi:hypothetical protein